MSVIVKGMDMPIACSRCGLTGMCRRWMDVESVFDRHRDCPLVEVLTPHGRMIDAVPVIRCRDCKYYDGYYCHNKYWGDGYGNYPPPIKEDDGFCDWAERKEE